MTPLANFFIPGEIMVQRLQEVLPSLRVRRVQDYAQAQREVSGSVPEVLVRLLRATVADSAGDTALLEQQYTAFYAVPGSFEDWDRDGPVLAQIVQALTGYEPDDAGIGAFTPVGSMVPQTWEQQGVVVYPVSFSVPVRL